MKAPDFPSSLLRFLLPFLLILPLVPSPVAGENDKTAVVLTMKGALGPAMSDYLVRGIRSAEERQAALVILRMDTPGGLDHAMRSVIQAVLASPVPVAVYVSPSGSRAASAGTYILYAGHIAAMAPATNLGAATPVRIGGLPHRPEKTPSSGDEKSPDALERKMVNDAAAYIKGLARQHGRNEEWAEQAVREAVSLTAAEALHIGVIDLIADDIADLLRQVDGRTVTTATGERKIAATDIALETIEPDWRNRLLGVISDPNIAYILLLLGIYGLVFELANPGFILPGVAGAICLLLAFYTFQVLPVNYAGLGLIILGTFFMIAEAFVPSFGSLGIGGLVAFVAGSIILMNDEGMSVSLSVIAGTAIFSASLMVGVIGRTLSLRQKKYLTGSEELIGSTGIATDDFDGEGRIWVHSESWRAICPQPVKKGQRLRVTAKEGLLLKVEIFKEEN